MKEKMNERKKEKKFHDNVRKKAGTSCSRMSAALVPTIALHLMQHLCAAPASSAAGFVYRASQGRLIVR